MRNGNNKKLPTEANKIEFLSYLWGMETSLVLLQENPDFEFLSYLWGMETSSVISATTAAVCSYPTYEEWKLVSQLINQIHYFHRVLILPMRNGNNSNGLSAYISYLFLSYLWGMETILSIIRISEKFRFLSYLWGMETIFLFLLVLPYILRSYPTYEEWKLWSLI